VISLSSPAEPLARKLSVQTRGALKRVLDMSVEVPQSLNNFANTLCILAIDVLDQSRQISDGLVNGMIHGKHV
jgi:hypothetical protein